MIPERQNALAALYQRVFASVLTANGHANGVTPSLSSTISHNDAEIIDWARKAKNWPKIERLLGGDTDDYGGDESSADAALAACLAFYTDDPNQIERLMRASRLERPKWDSKRRGGTYLSETIANILAKRHERYRPGYHEAPARSSSTQLENDSVVDSRIHLNAADPDLQRITAAAWDAIVLHNRPAHLFRFAGQLVRVETGDDARPTLRVIDVDMLRDEASQAAIWEIERKREIKGHHVSFKEPVKPPMDVVRNMRAVADIPLPILQRITDVPYAGPDAEIVTEPGYYPPSQTYLAPKSDLVIPSVPLTPTAADVERAKSLYLNDLLPDFPFARSSEPGELSADLVNALSLPLEIHARDLITGPTPIHFFDASSVGSGKTLLAEMLLFAPLGTIGLLSLPETEEEMRKTISANLSDGYGCIFFDNVARPVDSAALAMAATLETWRDRRLGANEILSIRRRASIIITGNNLVMSKEQIRRGVHTRLVPMQERPWERDPQYFTHPEIRAWVKDHRGDLIWAGLVLIRNWVCRGRPPGKVSHGSFEEWSRVIGGILEAAGFTQFLKNRRRFDEEADLEGAALRNLVGEWREKFGTNDVTTAELFEIADDVEGLPIRGKEPKARRTSFGMFLSSNRDRVVDGYVVTLVGKHRRASVWKLVSVNLVNLGEPFVITPCEEIKIEKNLIGKGSQGLQGSHVETVSSVALQPKPIRSADLLVPDVGDLVNCLTSAGDIVTSTPRCVTHVETGKYGSRFYRVTGTNVSYPEDQVELVERAVPEVCEE
jgi:hypothetical protein